MIYVVLFLLSFVLTYLIKEYAIKKSLVATVNERSSHKVPTPHGGGIAIALTWFTGILYLYWTNQIEPPLFYTLLFGLVITVVSFFDDLYELRALYRLIAQAFVAIGGLYFLGGLGVISFGIFEITNPFITNIFAFLMILWYINLTNFIDGIDGYVGSGILFLSLAGLFLFSGGHFGILAVAILGFLCWNYRMAKIFMGDAGSTLLGYNIAIFTLYYTNQEASNLWIWIILFGVFWFDATVTLIRRKFNGEKLAQAHKKHAYQRLVQAGWSHSKVTNAMLLLQAIMLGFVLFFSNLFLAFIASMVLLYFSMRFVDYKMGFLGD